MGGRVAASLAVAGIAVVAAVAGVDARYVLPVTLVLVLFVPGLAVLGVVGHRSTVPGEGPAIAAALSIAAIIVLGVFLDGVGIGLTRLSWTIGLAALVAICAVMTVIRKPRVVRRARPRLPAFERGVWARISAVVAIVGAAVAVTLVSQSSWLASQPYTELSISGTTADAVVRVRNDEGGPRRFVIRVERDGGTPTEMSLGLDDGESWQRRLPPGADARSSLRVSLLRAGSSTPYRMVQLKGART